MKAPMTLEDALERVIAMAKATACLPADRDAINTVEDFYVNVVLEGRVNQ